MSRFSKAGAGSLLVISNLSTAASQWVLILLLAVLGGAADVGEYSLALAVVTPVFIIVDFSLRNVYVTNQAVHRFQEYVSVRFWFGVVGVGAAIVLGLFLRLDPLLVALIALGRFTLAILELAFGFFQKIDKIIPIVVAATSNSVLTVVIGGWVFWSTDSLSLSLVGVLFGSIGVIAVIFGFILKSDSWKKSSEIPVDSRESFKRIIGRGLPSGLAFASVAVMSYLPIYFLGAYSTSEIVGVFTALSYFITFANIFYNSIQQLSLNDYVRSYRDFGVLGLRRVAGRLQLKLICVGLVSAAGFQVLGADVIRVIYGPTFVPPVGAIALTSVTLLVLPVIYVTGALMLTLNLYGRQFIVGLASLVGAGLVGILVSDRIDLVFAALITLVGTILRLLISGLVVRPYLLRPVRVTE